MKALTIWQPWASLIMIGAKPYEFRGWDFRTRDLSLVGQRIVIHAGTRPMRPAEIDDIVNRLDDGESSLDDALTMRLISHIIHQTAPVSHALPLACGLGTAVLGEPKRVTELFIGADSDRLDHFKWAWPLTDIQAWDEPMPCRGMQGFWSWPFKPDPAVFSPASDPPAPGEAA